MTDAERPRCKASNFRIKNEQSHDSLMLVCFSQGKRTKTTVSGLMMATASSQSDCSVAFALL